MREGVYCMPHYKVAQGKTSTYNRQHGDVMIIAPPFPTVSKQYGEHVKMMCYHAQVQKPRTTWTHTSTINMHKLFTIIGIVDTHILSIFVMQIFGYQLYKWHFGSSKHS